MRPVTVKDMGRCPQCGAWNSMVEEIVVPAALRANPACAYPAELHSHSA